MSEMAKGRRATITGQHLSLGYHAGMIFSRIHNINKRVLRRTLDEIIPGEWFTSAYSLANPPPGTRGGGAFIVFKDSMAAMKAHLVVNVTSSIELDDEENRQRALYSRLSNYYPWEDAPNRDIPHDGYLIVRPDDTVETAEFIPLGRSLTFNEITEIVGSRARILGSVRLQGHRGDMYAGDKAISYPGSYDHRPENKLGSRLGKFGRFSDRSSYRREGFAPCLLHGIVVIIIGRAR